MKFLHISDLHLGRRLGERELLDDQRAMLSQLARLAKERQVDGVLIAGDVYDRSLPTSEAVVLLDEFLTRLSDDALPVYIISGNHDAPQRLGYGAKMLKKQGVHLASVFSGSPVRYALSDEYGPVYLWLLPFFRLAGARQFFSGQELPDMTAAAKAVLQTLPIDVSARNVLVAHQFVTAGAAEPARSDSESVNVGTLENIDVSAFSGFDYVALGHIHAPQSAGLDTVRYCGSPLKYSASEDTQHKTALLVTLGQKGQVTIEKLPLCPLHDLRTVTGELNTLLENAQLSEDYIRARLTDQGPVADASARLRAVYPNLFKIESVANHPTALHAARVETMRRKTSEELFCEFFEQVTGQKPDEMQQKLLQEAMRGGEGE